jgi:hypothetical protein
MHNAQFLPQHHDLFNHAQIPDTEPFHFGPGPVAHNPLPVDHRDPFGFSHIPGSEHLDVGQGLAAHNQQSLPPAEHQGHQIPGLGPLQNPHAAMPELQHPRPVHAIPLHSLLDPTGPSSAAAGPSNAAAGSSNVAAGPSDTFTFNCELPGCHGIKTNRRGDFTRHQRSKQHLSAAAGRPRRIVSTGRPRAGADCSGTYRYNCEAHNYRTNDPSNFSRHKKTMGHTDKRYPCSDPDCGMTYTRPDAARNHERDAHGIGRP